MKKSIKVFLILAICLLVFIPSKAEAAPPHEWVDLVVHGEHIFNKENDMTNKGWLDYGTSRTFVPVRKVSEILGYKVDWDEEERKVTISNEDTVIELWGEQSKVVVNGVEGTIEAPPFFYKYRTFVPVRFVAETMGEEVNWDNVNKIVFVGHPIYENPKNGDTLTFRHLGLKMTMPEADQEKFKIVQSRNYVYFFVKGAGADLNLPNEGIVYTLERDKMSVKDKTGGDIFRKDGEYYIQGYRPSDVTYDMSNEEVSKRYNEARIAIDKALKTIENME